jgi:hypothetical protein
MQVYFNEAVGRKDIIQFYNEIYIKTMKEYIIAMKPTVSRTPGIKQSAPLMTP